MTFRLINYNHFEARLLSFHEMWIDKSRPSLSDLTIFKWGRPTIGPPPNFTIKLTLRHPQPKVIYSKYSNDSCPFAVCEQIGPSLPKQSLPKQSLPKQSFPQFFNNTLPPLQYCASVLLTIIITTTTTTTTTLVRKEAKICNQYLKRSSINR